MDRPRRQVVGGIAASPGIAVGKVCLLEFGRTYVPRRYIAHEDLEAEERRLHAAIEASRRELEIVRSGLLRNEQRVLLDAQLLMHRDDLLIDGAVELLRERRVNAEWALAQTIARIADQMRGASEPYFRDRAVDIENVGERILRELTGTVPELPDDLTNAVIVAEDLGPADAAQLLRVSPSGIVIELGSASSHTAILARALEVPAVVGARGIAHLLAEDDEIIVDGFRGEVIICPTDLERAQARERAERFRVFTRGLREKRDDVVTSRDGTTVRLDVNVELPAEASIALHEGASGIGLYRTEFLFLDRNEPPSEDEQAKVYADVAQVMSPRPVVFRTFDIGGDKLPSGQVASELLNPALGLRGLRLALANPKLFKTQLRAMLRASRRGNARIMFPLVTSLDELRQARLMLEEAAEELTSSGEVLSRPSLGVMIETPAAVMMAEELARECDFFSVGTNDLVQYTLVVDRSNPRVASYASTLHPAVLRLLQRTAVVARDAKVELGMCGGMAADPLAVPIVLGLGYDRLSVDLAYFAFVRALVRAMDLECARDAARDALRCATTAEVRALVIARFRDQLGELWREHGVEYE